MGRAIVDAELGGDLPSQRQTIQIAVTQCRGHRKPVFRLDRVQQITARSGRHVQYVNRPAGLVHRLHRPLQEMLDVDLARADPLPARRVEIDSIDQTTERCRALCHQMAQ